MILTIYVFEHVEARIDTPRSRVLRVTIAVVRLTKVRLTLLPFLEHDIRTVIL